jgi:hypothetical protein
VKPETERNHNRRRHTKTDETAKSSAASVAADNPSTSCTDASQDVQLERESSAWDTLGERFFCAASDGRFIYLSNDNTITTLSVSLAHEEFAAKPAPIDPSTIVQPNQATASQQETANDSRLEPLWLYITNVIDQIQHARRLIIRAMDRKYGDEEDSIRHSLHDINNGHMRRIQTFVSQNGKLVTESPVAQHLIHELNQLVHKANIFIQQFNKNDSHY